MISMISNNNNNVPKYATPKLNTLHKKNHSFSWGDFLTVSKHTLESRSAFLYSESLRQSNI